MKLTRSKKNKKSADIVKKKSIDFNEIQKSFESLDMQNYGSWPIIVKASAILAIVLLIAIFTYMIPVKDKKDEIVAAEAEQKTLLEEYREKESKARHLEEYKQQVAEMEIEFETLLDQLPKDTRISDVVKSVNNAGVGSNIIFKDIAIQSENIKEFFIEQPIRINATGDYHQFGVFISSLAAMPRIMTIHNFEVNQIGGSPENSNPELNLVLNTKTYRSKEVAVQSEEGGQ